VAIPNILKKTMTFIRFTPSQKASRALLGWMVIIALAFHGLIPLGYMPDISPKAGHPVQMTICDGMDMSSVDMDEDSGDDNAPAKNKADGKSSDHAPCPFSVNAVFSFGNLTPDIAAPIYIFIAIASFAALILTAQRRYINASPRAPPLPA
jgi:hypothetical protein